MSEPESRTHDGKQEEPRWVSQSELRFVTVTLPLIVDVDGSMRVGESHLLASKRATSLGGRKDGVKFIDEDRQAPLGFGAQVEAQRSDLRALLTATAIDAGVTVDADRATVGERVVSCARREPAQAAREVSEAVIRHHVSQILAAARLYHDWYLAWSPDIRLPRRASDPIEIARALVTKPPGGQLSALHKAALRGTDQRLAVRWRQLTPAAREILALSLQNKRSCLNRARLFFETAGSIVSAPMPPRELLLQILPRTIKFASRGRGRRFDREQTFVAVCRAAYLAVTLADDDGMTRGRLDVPAGPGADFVQRVEGILGIHALSEGSKHMIKRLRATDAAKRSKRNRS